MKNLFFISLLLIISCCGGNSVPKVNEGFEKKYGKEVKKIKSQQLDIVSDKQQKKQRINFYPPTPDEVSQDIFSQDGGYYPYVDVAKFGQDLPKNYLPDRDTYQQAQASKTFNQLPENVFEIGYNTSLHPSFSRFGAEFDAIAIPPYDVYGVKTKLENKPYLLAGNKFLQKSIDEISNQKTEQDIELSQILIKEQKQINLEQRMINVLDDEDFSKKSASKKDKIAAKKITEKTTSKNITSSPPQKKAATKLEAATKTTAGE